MSWCWCHSHEAASILHILSFVRPTPNDMRCAILLILIMPILADSQSCASIELSRIILL